jgi:hypothetical protein
MRPGKSSANIVFRAEVTNDLDTEPVLLQRDHGRVQRRLIGQRGEAVRDGSRAHYWSSLMEIAPVTEGPGSQLAGSDGPEATGHQGERLLPDSGDFASR